ncbi:MAG: hypothetical protein IPI10_15345 [Bacteroidetes bacterium]|nr:hypothetical protein [Bacteroidota bacterium]
MITTEIFFTTGIYNRNATFESVTLTGDTIYDFYIEKTSCTCSATGNSVDRISFTPINCTDLHLSFTSGSGANRIIIARALSVNVTPVDGNTYSKFCFWFRVRSGKWKLCYLQWFREMIWSLPASPMERHITFQFLKYNGLLATTNYLTSSPAIASGTSEQ